MGRTELFNMAIELLEQLNPTAPKEELTKVANFGFGLAASPIHFIQTLQEQLKVD